MNWNQTMKLYKVNRNMALQDVCQYVKGNGARDSAKTDQGDLFNTP